MRERAKNRERERDCKRFIERERKKERYEKNDAAPEITISKCI